MTEQKMNLLHKLIDGNSSSSVKLLEAIYDTNAQQLFQEYAADELEMPGLRLDLFFPETEAKCQQQDQTAEKELNDESAAG